MSENLLQAAGVVAFDRRGRVAIVHRPRYGDWSLPKGKVEWGESHPVAAVRECLEETSTTVRLEAPLGAETYDVEGVRKRVWFWRAFTSAHSEHDPTSEVDSARWLDPEKAARYLSYETDKVVLERAVQIGPTTPFTIVRHATATKRAAWRSSEARARRQDEERPLTPDGFLEADLVADVLSAYAIRRVVTSPSRRCRQTVEPFAARLGLRLEFDAVLSEESAAAERVDDLLRHLLRELPRRIAICSHRPVIPLITASLASHLKRANRSGRLDPRLRPGRSLILHVSGTRVVAVERW